MNATLPISAYGPKSQLAEKRKIAAELREKYASEYQAAPWWKKVVLVFRMQREAAHIYRHRLYSTSSRCANP